MDGNIGNDYWGSRGNTGGGHGDAVSRGGGWNGQAQSGNSAFEGSRGGGGPRAAGAADLHGGPIGSRGSSAGTFTRHGGIANRGEISLAEWRDGMMAYGDIPPKVVFSVCLEIARRADQLGKNDVFPELEPDSIVVSAGNGNNTPEIVGVGARDADGAGRRQYEVRPGKAGRADATMRSLACILYELFEGRRPPNDGAAAGAPVGIGILSAAQNRVLARAFADRPSKRFASCAAMVLAIRDGRDGRGWRPFAAVAIAIAVGAAVVLAYRGVERRFKAETEEIVQQNPNAGGGVVSSLDLLRERAEGGDPEALLELGERYSAGDGLEKDLSAAFDCFLKSAEAGNETAMVRVGRMLLEDASQGGNEGKAARWFEKAALKGSPEGRSLWAQCLWDGRGVASNREEAARWAFLATDSDIAEAQFIAGMCLIEGIGAAKDAPAGVRLVKRAADKGLADAELGMARIYASGIGVAKNGSLAVSWARRAAERGLPEAQSLLGGLLYAGAGGVPDKAEALKWYMEAAGRGNADAQAHAGAMFVAGDGVEKDPARGVTLLRQAADQDFPMAFSALARCHAEGWGVSKDGRKAAECLRRGAELGDPSAMGEYGASLVLGNIVPKNPAEGLKWLTKAAETGDPVQQLALSSVLLNGLAGRADEEAGMKWLEKAAASGLPEAQSELAIRLQKGNAKNTGEQDARSAEEQSFDLHLAAAKAGNVVSQSQIGTYYYNGYGCDRDYGEAFRWYLKAAEGGDDDAMVGVANCYDKGRGTPEDKKEALRWYKKAVNSSNAQIVAVAKRAVARLSADGAGDASDAAAALRIFRERAESGDIVAMYELAQRLDEGKGVAKDPSEAAKWWRMAAEVKPLRRDIGALQIGAWVQYGIHLLDGNGVSRNAREAAKWLEKAAEDTDEKNEMGLSDANLKLKALACRRLAECYDRGDGVPRDMRKATSWYQAGALNGDVESNLELGDRFCDGRAGYQDPMGNERWYERAANRGSAEGAYRAGMSYAKKGGMWRPKAEQWLAKAREMGHPKAEAALRDLKAGAVKSTVPAAKYTGTAGGTGAISAADAHNRGVAAAGRRNFSEAARWYRQAAEQGFGPSCANLGRMYYLGEGVPRNYSEAVKWYRKGGDAGNAVAQNGLAVCYLNGRGIARDPSEAARWFRKAAEQGNAQAQHSLGACYVNGDGVRKDYNEAIKWFRKAAAQGNAASKDALRQLGAR